MSTTTTEGATQARVGSEEVERFARDHPGLVKLGRVGWVAKGIVYALTGVLALTIALDAVDVSGDDEASQTGAISAIAQRSAGEIALYIAASGLVLHAVWRIATALLPANNDLHSWATRAGHVVSALTYLLLASTAMSLAYESRDSKSQDAQVEKFTREAMQRTGGRSLVGLVGLVLIGIGAYFLWKAISSGFENQLTAGGVGPLSHEHLITLGRIGWVGRSAMMGLIGFFLVRAALTFDPDDAEGLDGSLRKVADSNLGRGFVFVVAFGLMIYGVFCVVSAPRRRLAPADA